VKVVHGLPRRAPAVEDEPVAGFADALLPRDSVGGQEHLAQERRVSLIELGNRFNVFARHDEDVRRRLWRNVAKRDDLVALVDQFCRQAAIYNAAKDAVHLPPHFSTAARRARRFAPHKLN